MELRAFVCGIGKNVGKLTISIVMLEGVSGTATVTVSTGFGAFVALMA